MNKSIEQLQKEIDDIEDNILTNADNMLYAIYFYSVDVLNDRFKKGESLLCDSVIWEAYESQFIKTSKFNEDLACRRPYLCYIDDLIF